MFTRKVSGKDFDDIKSGKKNLELLINKDCDIFVGDYILFKKKFLIEHTRKICEFFDIFCKNIWKIKRSMV